MIFGGVQDGGAIRRVGWREFHGKQPLMRVICDFDGTIALQDSTNLTLEALADPAWRALQSDWEAGRLSGAACMQAQVGLIEASAPELDKVLDRVELDPGFSAFVEWCEASGAPLRIVSDGVDYFIARILTRHGLQRVPVLANRLVGAPGAWRLEHPEKPSDCVAGSGVCKCDAAGAAGREDTLVFVGDGRSDFCVSGRVDILFAKGELAAHAESIARPYVPFATFDDVRRDLAAFAGNSLPMLANAEIS